MIYYELVKVIIDVLALAKVIINIIICYHGNYKSIVANQS